MRTSLVHCGHIAGDGMEHDDYGDESFPDFPISHLRKTQVRMPNDGKYKELCGPVIVVNPGMKV